MPRARTDWSVGDQPMPLDMTANLDDLAKRLAIIKAETTRLATEEESIKATIRDSVQDVGTYPCGHGLTITLSPNRRFNPQRALELVTAPGNEPLAEMVAQYVLTVNRERLEALAPEVAAQAWDTYEHRVSVK